MEFSFGLGQPAALLSVATPQFDFCASDKPPAARRRRRRLVRVARSKSSRGSTAAGSTAARGIKRQASPSGKSAGMSKSQVAAAAADAAATPARAAPKPCPQYTRDAVLFTGTPENGNTFASMITSFLGLAGTARINATCRTLRAKLRWHPRVWTVPQWKGAPSLKKDAVSGELRAVPGKQFELPLALAHLVGGCHLRELSFNTGFYRNDVHPSWLEAVAAHCPHLELLDLAWCNGGVTDAGIAALAARCPRLASLAMDCCGQITDGALRSLGRHSAELAELSVAWCGNLTDAALADIGRCPQLGYLDVSQCGKLTAPALAAAAERHGWELAAAR